MADQHTFPLGGPAPTVEQVLAAIREVRIQPVRFESEIYEALNARFDARGIPYDREVRLGPRNRIDYLIADIGVEVKKGKPNSRQLAEQAERYCRFSAIQFLILVVERNVWVHDDWINGKPVYYVSLNRLWGIAL